MKRALVTGGSGDIGQAICFALAKSNFEVLVHTNTNLELAKNIVQNIIDYDGKASFVSFDLTDQKATHTAIEKILEQGAIQVLVNNAGLHDDAVFAGMKHEQWLSVIDVNLNGFYNVTQPLMLPMMQTRWGRIINLSSISGVIGNRGQANYAAAKAGIIGASKSLAIEMASRGITVNVVAPGIIEGSMTNDIYDKETIKKIVPMKRAGTVEEVASLVAFLTSDAAAYISAQVIGINGAMA